MELLSWLSVLCGGHGDIELPSWSLLLRETITWSLLRCKLLLPNVQREAHGVSSVWSGYMTWEAAWRADGGGVDSKNERSEGPSRREHARCIRHLSVAETKFLR